MKILKDEETPIALRELMRIVHDIAENTYGQVWDIFCEQANNLQPEWTGDQVISAASTLAAHFIGRWVQAMHLVASQDETGYTADDLLNDLFKGAAKTISAKVPVRKENNDFEFKRL